MPAPFAKGDRVVDPDNPTATAVVVGGPEVIGPQRFYLVRNQAGEETYFGEGDLTRRGRGLNSPVSWLTQHALSDPDHLARLLTQVKLTSSLTDIIYSLSSTRTLFRVHQFKPVLKLIQSTSHRLLLADEVGLGKTIEAGLIWAEIDARSLTRRVLVVCPSGLRTKWQTEMRRRFDREMEIADRTRLLELLDLYEERGDAARFFAISSYNTVRHDDVVEQFSIRPATLDLVIADEAHAMRNPETRTHQIGELLAQNSTSLLLLSATPINLGSEDLYQLLHLLHPDQYRDFEVFSRVIGPNEHINAALVELTRNANPDARLVAGILRRVEGTPEAARFLRNPVYNEVIEQLNSIAELSPGDVNRLAQEISGLNTLAAAYNRTRKRDLTDHVAVRRAHTLEVDFTSTEQEIYEGAVTLVAHMRSRLSGTGTGLATVMPARQAASCIPVMGDYLQDLLTSGRLQTDFEEGEEDDESMNPVEHADDTSEESRADAERLIERCRQLHGVDSKLERLTTYLRALRREGARQALLFSFFRRTLSYLKEQLDHLGFACEVMNGLTPVSERDELMRRFRAGDIEILLCSEIGSEGLDFEFCNVVINYDLPWNPMRVEQRIGRVDRFGQTNPVVHIVNFEVPGTIDTEIFLRLYRRIGVFERSIGELEPILGRQLQELNRVLARSELSVREQTQLATRIALAVEHERHNLAQFEANRDRLVGADAFVSDSLERAYHERRYITPQELQRYVEGFLRDEASPARITGDGPVKALAGSPELADQLRTYGRRWSNPTFGELISALETAGPIAVTFDAEAAYQRDAEFINGRHPIVRAISEFYTAHQESLPQGGYARVPSARRGSYLFFVYRITASGLRASRTLMAVARNRETGAIDTDAGRELLTYLAGPDPVRMQQRRLPIVEEAEVDMAFESIQAEIVRHTRVLQEELQHRNDALIVIRQEELRSGLDVQRSRLLELATRPELNERIRRMRQGQIANLERNTDDQIADLEQHRHVRVGFMVVAGGHADFILR
jgi:superfamily II DNA or RNA helicase